MGNRYTPVHELAKSIQDSIKTKSQKRESLFIPKKKASPNWFSNEYKKGYKHKVKLHKSKDWLEKIKDEIKEEIANLWMDCYTNPLCNTEDKIRECMIMKAMTECGIPLSRFYGEKYELLGK